MKAEVANFYGWTDKEIDGLSYEKFYNYWRCISAIKSRDMLMAIHVESFPWLKKNKRQELVRHLKKKIDIVSSKTKPSSLAEIAQRMANKLQG